MEERKRHIRCAAPRNLVPMSRVLDGMDNIDLRYYQKDGWNSTAPKRRTGCHTDGLAASSILIDARARRRRAPAPRGAHLRLRPAPRAKGNAGYYHDILQPDGTVLNRDAAAVVPGIGDDAPERGRTVLDGETVPT